MRRLFVFISFISAVVGAISTAAASPPMLLYTGTIEVQAVSGKECTGTEVGRKHLVTMLLNKEGDSVNGYFYGPQIAVGKFSGQSSERLEILYPFFDRMLATGHSMSFKKDDNGIAGTINERHLDNTVEHCNWDRAVIRLSGPPVEAGAELSVAERRFESSLSSSTGLNYMRKKEYASAVPYLEKALAMREDIEGKGSPDVANYLDNLSIAYGRNGSHDKGRSLIESRIGDFGQETAQMLRTTLVWLYGNQADRLAEGNDCQKATILYKKALDVAESTEYGNAEKKEDTLLQLHEDLAGCLLSTRDFTVADAAYSRVVSLKEKKWQRPRRFVTCPEPKEKDPIKAVAHYASGHLPRDEYSLKTAQCFFSTYSGKIPYSIKPSIIKEQPELAIAILQTESIDKNEKQYWFDILPSMNELQTDRLLQILTVENKRLHDLEIKYMHEIKALNKRHLFEWNFLKLSKEKKNGEIADLIESANIPEYPVLLLMQAGLHRSRRQWSKAAESLEHALKLIEQESGIRTADGLAAAYNLAIVRLEQGDLAGFGRILKENNLLDYPLFDPASVRIHHLDNDNVWLSSNEEANRFFTTQMPMFSENGMQSADAAKKLKMMLALFADGAPFDSRKNNRLFSLREELLKLAGQSDRLPQSRLVVNKGCGDRANSIWSGTGEYVTLSGNNVSLCSREGDRLIITVTSPLAVRSASYKDNAIHILSDNREFIFDLFSGRILRIHKKKELKGKNVQSGEKAGSRIPGYPMTALGEDYHAVASGSSITLYNIPSLITSEADLKADCPENIREIKAIGSTLVLLCGKKLIAIDMNSSPVKVSERLAVQSDAAFIGTSNNQVALYSPSGKTFNTYVLPTLKPGLNPGVTSFSGEKSQRVLYADSGRVITTRDDSGNKGIITVYSSGAKNRPLVFDQHFSTVRGIDVSDGIAATFSDDQLLVWSLAAGKTFWSRPAEKATMVKIIKNTVILASGNGDIKKYYLYTGDELSTFRGHDVPVKDISGNHEKVTTLGEDGAIKLWSPSLLSGASASERFVREKITLLYGNSRDWIVTDPEGRFDSSNIDDLQGLHWIVSDAPLTPLPFEIFMKDYYEPRLLQRVLAGEKFNQIRLLQNLKMVQPDVRITSVRREENSGTVRVEVEVARGERSYRQHGATVKSVTGVHDLKLFRDGQLIAFNQGEAALDKATGKGRIVFNGVRLPAHKEGDKVQFSAYAFNDDGIKSRTSVFPFPVLRELAHPTAGKAYLITIGVSRHENPAWNISYAAHDAVAISKALESGLKKQVKGRELVSVLLVDEKATRENIKGVLKLLAGKELPEAVRRKIPNADVIARSGPDDFVLISFSGHGFVDGKGGFHAIPYDTGSGSDRSVTPDLTSRSITSSELSEWIRDIDAGDMAMLVDSCYSAATVAAGDFKPGPMGSRGMGQLAYDKRMMILTATQADNLAMESDSLQHGLLTYALVNEGIERFKADYKPEDDLITLAEWLEYGVKRVPSLYRELREGDFKTQSNRSPESIAPSSQIEQIETIREKKRYHQTPVLFDFSRKRQQEIPLVTRQGK